MRALSHGKSALLHLAKHRLGMTDDDYRSMLRRVAGVDSSRDLDSGGFNDVMAEFERLGFRSYFGNSNLGNRAGMATPRQVALIKQLWREYVGVFDGPAPPGDDEHGGKLLQLADDADRRLRRWLDSHWKIGDLRFVTGSQAFRVIGALKKMKKKADAAPVA